MYVRFAPTQQHPDAAGDMTGCAVSAVCDVSDVTVTAAYSKRRNVLKELLTSS